MRKIIKKKHFVWQRGKIFEELNGEQKANEENFSIAIVIDTVINIPPLAGVTYRLFHLTKALQKKGHSVTWIIGNRNLKNEDQLDELLNAGIKIHLLEPSLFYNVKYVSGLLVNEDIDIVQYEISQTFLQIGTLIRELNNIPVVLECHDIEACLRETLERGEESSLMEFLQTIAGLLADAVVAMTPLDLSTLKNRMDVQDEKVFLSPNGVSSDQAINERIDTQGKTLVFLGNMFYQPNKDAAIFLGEEILPRVKEKAPEVKLKLIGLTPECLLEKFSDNPQVILKGEIKNEEGFNKELRTSTIGVCPVYSGSGMKVKILNYALAGLPIVSTSVGASGYERLKSLIVEDDVDKFARKIVQLLDSEEKCIKIGRSNREDSLTYYSWNRAVDIMEKAYSLAQGFDIANMKKCDISPFWLEEGRDETEVLNGHYIIDNKKYYEKRNDY